MLRRRFLLVAGCIPYLTRETPYVSGVVIEADTRQAVGGARVSWDRYQQTPVVTSADGHFEIPTIRQFEMIALAPYDRFIQDLYLIVQAPGHATLRVKMNGTKDTVGATFTLRRQ